MNIPPTVSPRVVGSGLTTLHLDSLSRMDSRYLGPWPDVNDLILAELDAYLATAGRPDVRNAATRCEPWTGDQVTAHVAATFARFTAMLKQSRAGDLTPPFARDELNAQNLRAVEGFVGDPVAALRKNATEFCGLAEDPAEVMAHQFGPIPVGLQAIFGLSDLALHHDDLWAAVGERYRPAEAVIDPIAAGWAVALDEPGLLVDPDPWAALLAVSGRERPENHL